MGLVKNRNGKTFIFAKFFFHYIGIVALEKLLASVQEKSEKITQLLLKDEKPFLKLPVTKAMLKSLKFLIFRKIAQENYLLWYYHFQPSGGHN